MPDVLTRVQRSLNMRSIRGKNTKPEIILRKALWRRGLRYRLKSRLPGKPDLVFPTKRVVVFIDGCFWHGCILHWQQPATRSAFWASKIRTNMGRDRRVTALLKQAGWQVLRFWEHEIKRNLDDVVNHATETLKSIGHDNSSRSEILPAKILPPPGP